MVLAEHCTSNPDARKIGVVAVLPLPPLTVLFAAA